MTNALLVSVALLIVGACAIGIEWLRWSSRDD